MAFAAALCTTVFASCQKINESDLAASAGDIITKTLPVSRELWTSEATKSTYEEGVGLYLTGDEHISVYYSPYVDGQTGLSDISDHPVEATPSGNGNYTFAHDDLGADSYNYYFVMPHSVQNRSGNGATQIAVRLSPVQFPGDNNIDATNDYLVGRPQTDLGKADALQVTEFKRLFAPFRLMVTDSQGILGNEKLFSATLSFDKTPGSTASLTGYAYLSTGDNYEDNFVDSFTSASRSNAVSAVSDSGIGNGGEGYPVWFLLNPMVFEAGVNATLTVSSESKTVSRTVALPREVSIVAGKLNELSFDISGSGILPPEESVTQSFVSLTSAESSLTASDGNSYSWGFNDCRFNYGEGSVSGVRLNGSSIDLPAFPGKTLVGLKLFSHKRNGGAASAMETDNIITVKSGDADVVSGNFNYFAVSPDGGVLDLDIPEEYASAHLSLVSNSTSSLISAITFIFENSAASDPDAPHFEDAVSTDPDYNHLYLGREVTVTGENLDKVTSFVVDGVSAPVVGTQTAAEAHFVMPETISGNSARPVALSAVTSEGTVVLGTITVHPFHCTKGLRLGVGANRAADYTGDGRSMSFLMFNEGRVISAQEWVESQVDTSAASGSNKVTTGSCTVTGSEAEYDFVEPYTFIVSSGDVEDGDAKLAFVNPANSTSPLRNHRYPDNDAVIGAESNGTYGTPVVKFRVLTNDPETEAAVVAEELEDISYCRNMVNSNAPSLGTVAGSSVWMEGSVMLVQYLDYGLVSSGKTSPSNISDVARQGYMYIRDITCADLATGFPLYPTTGYVEFDLYWSNPLN